MWHTLILSSRVLTSDSQTGLLAARWVSQRANGLSCLHIDTRACSGCRNNSCTRHCCIDGKAMMQELMALLLGHLVDVPLDISIRFECKWDRCCRGML